MEYKGYIGEYVFDEVFQVYSGWVSNTKSVITFESDSIEGLKKEFEISVDVYIDWCIEEGVEPEIPQSS